MSVPFARVMHTYLHHPLCYVRSLVSQLKYDDFDYIYEEYYVQRVPAKDREAKPSNIREWKQFLPRVLDVAEYKRRCCIELCAFNGWNGLAGPEQQDIHALVVPAVVESVKKRREMVALYKEEKKMKRAKALKKRGKGVCYVEPARI